MKKILLHALLCMVTLSNVHALVGLSPVKDSIDSDFETRFAAALSNALKKAEIKKQVEDVSTQSKIDPVAGSKMSTHAFTHAYDAALMATNLKMLEQVNAMVEKMGVKKEEPKKEEKKKTLYDELLAEGKSGVEKAARNTLLYATSTISAIAFYGVLGYIAYKTLESTPWVGTPVKMAGDALVSKFYEHYVCTPETFLKTCGPSSLMPKVPTTPTTPTVTPTPAVTPTPTATVTPAATPSLPSCGSAVQYFLSYAAGHCK